MVYFMGVSFFGALIYCTILANASIETAKWYENLGHPSINATEWYDKLVEFDLAIARALFHINSTNNTGNITGGQPFSIISPATKENYTVEDYNAFVAYTTGKNGTSPNGPTIAPSFSQPANPNATISSNLTASGLIFFSNNAAQRRKLNSNCVGSLDNALTTVPAPPNAGYSSTCIVIIFTANGDLRRCTGWFSGRGYVVTAGHCVWTLGMSNYDVSVQVGSFGAVVCAPNGSNQFNTADKSLKSSVFMIQQVIVSSGYPKAQQYQTTNGIYTSGYDMSVLQVRPIAGQTDTTKFGQPLVFGGFGTNSKEPCLPIPDAAGVLGFPGPPDSPTAGCPTLPQGILYSGYSGSQMVKTSACSAFGTPAFGTPYTFYMSACPGMSGGPLTLFRNGRQQVVGGLSTSTIDCSSGSYAYFPRAITAADAQQDPEAVCVTCLMAALSGKGASLY